MTTKGISRRSFMRRVVGLAGSLAAISVVGAGCAPKATPAPTAAPQADTAPTAAPVKAVDKITLRVQVQGGTLGQQIHDLCAQFAEQNPDFEIKAEDVPYSDIPMKTEMGFATGDLQDVLHAFTRWFWLGSYKGWYLPLDDYLASTNAIPGYPDDFYEVWIENSRFSGKTYGIVDSGGLGGGPAIIWNRHLIAEAGADPPTSEMDIWDLHELALRCTDVDSGVFGIELTLGTQCRQSQLFRCWGRPEYGPDGDTSSWITSPDGKEFRFLTNSAAKEFYTEWFTPLLSARAHPKSEDAVTEGLFVAGKCAMVQGHQGFPRRFERSIGDSWEFHPEDAIVLPKGPEGRLGTVAGDHFKCVYSKTKHPEEALRLVGYLTSAEAGKVAFDLTGSYSGRKSVWRNPDVVGGYPIYGLLEEAMLDAGIVEPYPIPWNLRDVEFTDTLRNLLDPLFQGTKAWDEQAPIVQEEVQKLFDQPRP